MQRRAAAEIGEIVCRCICVSPRLEQQLKAAGLAPLSCEIQRRAAVEVCRVLVSARLEQQTEAGGVTSAGRDVRRSQAHLVCVHIRTGRERTTERAPAAGERRVKQQLVLVHLLDDESVYGGVALHARRVALLAQRAHSVRVGAQRLHGEQQRVALARCRRSAGVEVGRIRRGCTDECSRACARRVPRDAMQVFWLDPFPEAVQVPCQPW